MSAKPQRVDLALGLLDHQLVDSLGRNCGKVDELVLTGLDSDEPEIAEILVGGNAWRSRGRLGRLLARLSGQAVHVPWSAVKEVSEVVTLREPAPRLRLGQGDERWGRWVAKLPGSGPGEGSEDPGVRA
jgi:sporulation protein YlmC with PRC-barrel domain